MGFNCFLFLIIFFSLNFQIFSFIPLISSNCQQMNYNTNIISSTTGVGKTFLNHYTFNDGGITCGASENDETDFGTLENDNPTFVVRFSKTFAFSGRFTINLYNNAPLDQDVQFRVAFSLNNSLSPPPPFPSEDTPWHTMYTLRGLDHKIKPWSYLKLEYRVGLNMTDCIDSHIHPFQHEEFNTIYLNRAPTSLSGDRARSSILIVSLDMFDDVQSTPTLYLVNHLISSNPPFTPEYIPLLLWTLSNFNYHHFNIYRNGTFLDITTKKFYADLSVIPGEDYFYEVSVVDNSITGRCYNYEDISNQQCGYESDKVGNHIHIPKLPFINAIGPRNFNFFHYRHVYDQPVPNYEGICGFNIYANRSISFVPIYEEYPVTGGPGSEIVFEIKGKIYLTSQRCLNVFAGFNIKYGVYEDFIILDYEAPRFHGESLPCFNESLDAEGTFSDFVRVVINTDLESENQGFYGFLSNDICVNPPKETKSLCFIDDTNEIHGFYNIWNNDTNNLFYPSESSQYLFFSPSDSIFGHRLFFGAGNDIPEDKIKHYGPNFFSIPIPSSSEPPPDNTIIYNSISHLFNYSQPFLQHNEYIVYGSSVYINIPGLETIAMLALLPVGNRWYGTSSGALSETIEHDVPSSCDTHFGYHSTSRRLVILLFSAYDLNSLIPDNKANVYAVVDVTPYLPISYRDMKYFSTTSLTYDPDQHILYIMVPNIEIGTLYSFVIGCDKSELPNYNHPYWDIVCSGAIGQNCSLPCPNYGGDYGRITATCQQTLQWTFLDECYDPPYCPHYPILNNTYFDPECYNTRQIECYGECNEGFLGEVIAYCDNDHWIYYGGCYEIRCDSPPSYEGADFDCIGTETKCVGTCQDPYYGLIVAECFLGEESGFWSYFGYCLQEPIDGCIGQPQPLEHSSFPECSVSFGTQCIGTCESGYDGHISANCAVGYNTPEWIIVGSCYLPECLEQPSFPSTTFPSCSLSSNTTCIGNCIGTSNIISAECYETTWIYSGSCAAPSICSTNPTHLNVIFPFCADTAGTECQGVCSHGFTGSITATCTGVDWVYSGDCVPLFTDCLSLPHANHASFPVCSLDHGTTCVGTCSPGTSGSISATCSNGNWIYTGSCTLNCQQPVFSHVNFPVCLLEHGSFCEGDCIAGYIGSVTATCNSGIWDFDGSCSFYCPDCLPCSNPKFPYSIFNCETINTTASCKAMCEEGYKGDVRAYCFNETFSYTGTCSKIDPSAIDIFLEYITNKDVYPYAIGGILALILGISLIMYCRKKSLQKQNNVLSHISRQHGIEPTNANNHPLSTTPWSTSLYSSDRYGNIGEPPPGPNFHQSQPSQQSIKAFSSNIYAQNNSNSMSQSSIVMEPIPHSYDYYQPPNNNMYQ